VAAINQVDAWDERTDRRPGVSAHNHFIDIDPRRWPAVAPQVGDLVQRTDDGARWRVARVERDDMGRAGMAAVDALLPTQPAATWSQATKAAADHAGNQTVRDAVAILLAASRQQAA
jgi:hypothetical protein